MSETVWQRRDCVSAEVEGSLVLLDLETLVYHSLNSTASAVWGFLETPRAKHSLVEALCERYKVEPAHCDASVGRLLDALKASNLVKPVEASATLMNQAETK